MVFPCVLLWCVMYLAWRYHFWKQVWGTCTQPVLVRFLWWQLMELLAHFVWSQIFEVDFWSPSDGLMCRLWFFPLSCKVLILQPLFTSVYCAISLSLFYLSMYLVVDLIYVGFFILAGEEQVTAGPFFITIFSSTLSPISSELCWFFSLDSTCVPFDKMKFVILYSRDLISHWNMGN